MSEEKKKEIQETEETPKSGDLVSEIDAMVKGLGDDAEPTKGGGSPEGGDDDVKPEEGSEGEEAGKEEEKEAAEPGVKEKEEPKADEAAEETPPKEEDPRDAEIKKLREEKADLQKTIDEKSEIKPTEPKETEKEKEVEVKDLLDNVDYESVVSSPENFVNFLKQFRDDVIAKSHSDIYRTLPTLVMKQSSYASALREATNNFWKENQDLTPVRKTVGAVVNELISKNPDWTLEQIFSEAGDATRKMLKIEKEVGTGEETKTTGKSPGKKDPAFASSRTKNAEKGGAPTKEEQTVADEIDELQNL